MAPSNYHSGPRPRLSKVLTLTQTPSCSSSAVHKLVPFAFDAWSNMTPPVVSEPDMEHITQAIMTKLLSDPHSGLPASFNSLVMRAIESHTKLKLETVRLRADLDDAQQAKKLLNFKLQKETADWVLRELDYEAEVERLKEKLSPRTRMFETPRIFKKKRALAPSSFRRRSGCSPPRQTVYEFLKDSGSPSKSPAPTKMVPRSPVQSSTPLSVRPPPAEPDASSAFSSEADTLSDNASDTRDVTADEDFASIRRLAEIMVRRRGVGLDHALARLSAAFFGEDDESPETVRAAKQAPTIDSLDAHSAATTSDLLISRARSPLSRISPNQRVFSFHPGDDSSFQSRLLTALDKQEENEKPVRRVSTVGSPVREPESTETPTVDKLKSPLLAGDSQESDSPSQSPSMRSAAMNDLRSRIPSPAYSSSTAGRPRPRRETTSSSTSTAIRRSPLDASSPFFGGSYHVHGNRSVDSARSSK